MKIVSGEILVAGRLAYVPEHPWIVSASLRDNILLGSEFDQERSDLDAIHYTAVSNVFVVHRAALRKYYKSKIETNTH